MSNGLLCHIKRHDWQLFVTCTYRNSRTMSEKIRRGMQFSLLRRMALIGHKGSEALAFPALEWVLREEFGEETNRLHWHALISGLPKGIIRPTTCMFLMGFWEGVGGGMSRIRVYEGEQDATSYITKGLEAESGRYSLSGANAYEVGKFQGLSGSDPLMLIPSKSLLAKWKRQAYESRMHAERLQRGPKQDLFA